MRLPFSNKARLPSNWSARWLVVLLGAIILFVMFIVASIELIHVAIVSQPDCVAHDRLGEHNTSTVLAAKSAC